MPSTLRQLTPKAMLLISISKYRRLQHARSRRRLAGLLATLLASSAASGETLRQTIQARAEQQGFTVKGLEHIRSNMQIPESELADTPLRLLLRNHDHVLEHHPDGRIKRLIVLGVKAPPPEPAERSNGEIILQTEKRGEHHLINASVQNKQGKQQKLKLMVDTGASMTVVPASIIQQLGLDNVETGEVKLQTANGKVSAKSVVLDHLMIDGLRIEQLSVAVLPDDSLGPHGLLGMDVLSRYIFFLDDKQNQLILTPDAN